MVDIGKRFESAPGTMSNIIIRWLVSIHYAHAKSARRQNARYYL